LPGFALRFAVRRFGFAFRCCGGFSPPRQRRARSAAVHQAPTPHPSAFFGLDFAMPNPIIRIVRDPHIVLDSETLSDKPDMAILVTEIFAIWASIEHSLSLLLVRVLGAAESPAVAMFSVLTAQHLQNKALEAAAKAALEPKDYQVFLAVTSVTDSAQKPRNQLAHWVWATCKQRPDLLCVADPQMLKERDLRVAKYYDALKAGEPFRWERTWDIYQFNPEHILAYSKADLERAKHDLLEAKEVLFELEFYLQPEIKTFLGFLTPIDEPPEVVRGAILDRLNTRRLFREALARIRADQKNIQQPTPAEPEPMQGETA
jgi:hypothetical protein